MNHREALEKMTSNGMVQIYFYTKHEEVLLPVHLTETVEVLNFSRAFSPGGDADMLVTKEGISQTLSFTYMQQWCFIPYEAMIFMVSPPTGMALLTDPRFESCVRDGSNMNTQEDMMKAMKEKCVQLYGDTEKKNPFTLLKGGKSD